MASLTAEEATQHGRNEAGESPQETRRTPPSRTVVRGIFLLLGIGILAPWNAFISAKDYFDKRLCNETLHLESKFSLIYNLASVASLGLLIAIQTVIDRRKSEQRSLSERDGILMLDNSSNMEKEHSFFMVILPLGLYLVAFLGQAIMVRVINMPFFLSLTFIGLALCGMACSIAQAGIVATAGLFHSNLAMNPYLEGMSLGGVAVSLANFGSAFYGDPQSFLESHCSNDRFLKHCAAYERVDEAVFGYFFLGTVTLGLCMIGFSYILRVQHHDDHGSYDSILQTNGSVDQPQPNSTPRIGLELRGAAQEEESSPTASLDPTNLAIQPMEHSANETADVWRKIKGPAFSIFLVFTVTLSLFPAWTSQIRSSHQCKSTWRMANDLFTPMTFVLFNVGDFIGRVLSSRVVFSTDEHRSIALVKAALLRFVFLILLFFCPGGEPSTYPGSDMYTVVVLLAFSVSNGYLLSTAFCHAPSLIVSVPELQERMAEILNLSVSLGLLAGSLLSFPVASLFSG